MRRIGILNLELPRRPRIMLALGGKLTVFVWDGEDSDTDAVNRLVEVEPPHWLPMRTWTILDLNMNLEGSR